MRGVEARCAEDTAEGRSREEGLQYWSSKRRVPQRKKSSMHGHAESMTAMCGQGRGVDSGEAKMRVPGILGRGSQMGTLALALC